MKCGFEQGGKHRENPNTRGLCHIVTALTPSSHENPSLTKKSSHENPLKKFERKGSQ